MLRTWNFEGGLKLTAIRQAGRINYNTALIDIGLFGVAGAGAVYLVKAEEKLLIDCGSWAHSEPHRIVRALKHLNSFPPDSIVLTHSHFDHCQGIHYIRTEAGKLGKAVRVMASDEAIPLLEDQSWQKVFEPKRRFENIGSVILIKDGETIDLKGLTLRVLEVPGHSKDCIALFDERHKNLFVGDSIGLKLGDEAYLPPFNSPHWDTEAFYCSVKKLRQIDYEGICLSHFGFIYGEEAQHILDEAITTFEKSWKIYESAEELDKLDDFNFLTQRIKEELRIVFPEFRPVEPSVRFLLTMMSIWRGLIGKKPYTAGEIFLRNYMVRWLAVGYKTYKTISERL